MRHLLSDDGLTQSHLIIQGDELLTVDSTPGKRIEKILDVNKRHRNDRDQNTQAHGRLAASVDPVIYYQWKKEWRERHKDSFTWKTYLVMKLNSRDYEFFRTQDSKIGLTSRDKG